MGSNPTPSADLRRCRELAPRPAAERERWHRPGDQQQERTMIHISARGRDSTGKARKGWQDRLGVGSCVPSVQRSPHLLPASSLTSGCLLSAATGRSNSRAPARQRSRSGRRPLTWFECLPAPTGKLAPRRASRTGRTGGALTIASHADATRGGTGPEVARGGFVTRRAGQLLKRSNPGAGFKSA